MIQSQKGATLFIVLIILLFMTVIGALAIRYSIVSLDIATGAQAQQLMFQNSDVAVFSVEDANKLKAELTGSGMFGYIRTANNKGKEIVFCYKGKNENLFTLTNASIMKWENGASAPNGKEIGVAGYCNPTSSTNDYTSGRQAVMTQISVQFATTSSSDDVPFGGMPEGTDATSGKVVEAEKVIVHAVSFMPQLSAASKSDIYNCLSKHMNSPEVPAGVVATASASSSVVKCLNDLSVPFIAHISEYNLVQNLKGTS